MDNNKQDKGGNPIVAKVFQDIAETNDAYNHDAYIPKKLPIKLIQEVSDKQSKTYVIYSETVLKFDELKERSKARDWAEFFKNVAVAVEQMMYVEELKMRNLIIKPEEEISDNDNTKTV